MTIRPAGPDDFEAVTELLEELGRPRVTDAGRAASRAVYERQLEDPDTCHLVACDAASRPIGFCSMHLRERLNHPTREAWIPDLIVTAAARRGGVARALLVEAERIARDRGCHALTLESGYRRAEAHHLYTRFGLRDTGKAFGKLLG